MALELGAFALVRAGTGIVQLLVGITFLFLARSSAGRLLGFSLIGYSAHYIVFDATSVDPSTQIVAATVAPIGFAFGTTAALALAWRIAPEARGRVAAFAAFAIAAGILYSMLSPDTDRFVGFAADVWRWTNGCFVYATAGVFGLVAALARLHKKNGQAGLALVALGMGCWMAVANTSFLGTNLMSGDWDLPFLLYRGAALVAAIAAGLLWVAAAGGPKGRHARDVGLLLAGALLLGAVLAAFGDGAGPPLWAHAAISGTRTLGAALVAAAVFRYGFLDFTVPRIVARRGTLAAVALAVLFIVAQVAQNFLSAQYGLLMGGVIAGAVLFAASPVQRAIERKQEGPPAIHVGGDSRAEASYRKALEWAMRDGRLNRDEEGHLHELAHNLGITGVRAHAILVEVEHKRELAGGTRTA